MIEAIIVADSSPIIGLARIGQLELLPRLAVRVLVPPSVWNEVTADVEAPGAAAVVAVRWMEVQAPGSAAVVPINILVDGGEAEAIVLAAEHSGSLLLIDDARARRVAESLTIRRIGTVGLLRRAKQQGLIEELRPQLDALLANGIFIRQSLIEAVLKEVGE